MADVTHKIRTAYWLFRNRGITSLGRIFYGKASLKFKIRVRARKKNIVVLDGCQFGFRNLADTTMKLELLSGEYEEPERSAAARYIRPEWAVVELGACIGVVACVTNKLLRNPKAHVVVEANPLVIPHLESNRETNHCSFKILNGALAYDTDTVTFSPYKDFWGNSLRHDGSEPPVTVTAITLRNILNDERFEKFALICDIEGHEYELVMRESEALRGAALIIMEVHPHMIGEHKTQTILSRLADLGFRIIERSALVIVFEQGVAA